MSIRQRALWIFGALLAAGFLWQPMAEPANNAILAAERLAEDIKILGTVIGQDISRYTPPQIAILPPDDFDAIINKDIKEGKLPPGKYVGYFNCENNVMAVSYNFVAYPVAHNIDLAKYFRMVRFHELYHWAMCQTKGQYRFHVNNDPSQPVITMAWETEERRALMAERQFWVAHLGMSVATEADYTIPHHPNEVRHQFPEELLRRAQAWKVEKFLIPSDTEDGGKIFLFVAWTEEERGGSTYTYNLVSHRGKFVGIEVFKSGLRFRAWYDKGYAGDPAGDKFPAQPVYVGEWTQIK